MAKSKKRAPSFAEEVILHVFYTTLSGGHTGESIWRTKVMADLGLEKDPKFTMDEMNQITYAAKQTALRIVWDRKRNKKS